MAHQNWPKLENNQNSKTKMQEVMERPERQRREGRRSVRFALGRQSSLFCVTVLFLYLCLLWVYVFYGFYVGPAKLQCGATPPSVMVLFMDKALRSPSGRLTQVHVGYWAKSCWLTYLRTDSPEWCWTRRKYSMLKRNMKKLTTHS